MHVLGFSCCCSNMGNLHLLGIRKMNFSLRLRVGMWSGSRSWWNYLVHVKDFFKRVSYLLCMLFSIAAVKWILWCTYRRFCIRGRVYVLDLSWQIPTLRLSIGFRGLACSKNHQSNKKVIFFGLSFELLALSEERNLVFGWIFGVEKTSVNGFIRFSKAESTKFKSGVQLSYFDCLALSPLLNWFWKVVSLVFRRKFWLFQTFFFGVDFGQSLIDFVVSSSLRMYLWVLSDG